MAGAFLMPFGLYNLTKQGVGRQRASLRRRLLSVRFSERRVVPMWTYVNTLDTKS